MTVSLPFSILQLVRSYLYKPPVWKKCSLCGESPCTVPTAPASRSSWLSFRDKHEGARVMTRNRSLNFIVSFEALNFVKCICSLCYQVSCMNGCMEPEIWLKLSRNTMFTRAFANSDWSCHEYHSRLPVGKLQFADERRGENNVQPLLLQGKGKILNNKLLWS